VTDYTAGMHRAAEIARELAAMAVKCGQGPLDPVEQAAATVRAILAEADEEVTPSAEVCTTCGQAVRQRNVVLPCPGADPGRDR
jgi:hypothetical protein